MNLEFYTLPIQKTLVRAKGQADAQTLGELNTRGHTIITSVLGDQNEIWLGKPEVFDLCALYQASHQSLPPHLATISQSSDLLLVHFACSFKSAPECEFVQATVRVLLQSPSNPNGSPVALDIFPRNVDMPISYKRGISVSPDLKIGSQQVPQIEASAFSYESSSEYVKYEPEITAFGVGESDPGWDFNKSRARSIRGVKNLFVLIKRSRGFPMEVRFDVSAWVQTSFAKIRLPSFFLSGSDIPLITEQYEIS